MSDRPAQPAPDLDTDESLFFKLHFQAKAAHFFNGGRESQVARRAFAMFEKSYKETREMVTTLRAQLAERQHAADMATIHAELLEARVTALEAALRKIEAEVDQPECCGNGTTGTAYEPPECCNQPLYGIDRAKRIAAAALKGDPT